MTETGRVESRSRIYPDADGDRMAHRLVVEIGSGWVTGEIVCESDRDAACRTVCRASECEEGCVDPEAHTRERVDYCNTQAFIDDEGWQETYYGERAPLRSGWITPAWNGNSYGWTYVGGAS